MQMHSLLISGNPSQTRACLQRHLPAGWQMLHVNTLEGNDAMADIAGMIHLDEPASLSLENIPENIPVLVSDASGTMEDYPASHMIARLNGWPGFLESPLVEFTSVPAHRMAFEHWFDRLEWAHQWVQDVPGMIRPRVLAMIINEACYAFGEGVSSKQEIDLAMKSGTNYPMGPFEWAARIGTEPIVRLLEKLSATDQRYLPAPKIREILNT